MQKSNHKGEFRFDCTIGYKRTDGTILNMEKAITQLAGPKNHYKICLYKG
jgi:hypothetical protein